MNKEYSVRTIDRNGVTVELTMQAESAKQVRADLEKKGMLAVEIREKGRMSYSLSSSKRFKDHELIFFLRQLLAMVSAGITIGEAVNILAERLTDEKLRALFKDLARLLSEGNSFSQALLSSSFEFHPLVISFVKQGEQSGDLSSVFSRLITYWERRRNAWQKVIDAMIYPAVLMLIVTGMVGFLLVHVVPTFTEMFSDMAAKLPYITRLVLSVSSMVRSHLVYAFLASCAFVVILRQLIIHRGDRVLAAASRLPILSNLINHYRISYFSLAMGSLLRAGMTVDDSLRVLQSGGDGDRLELVRRRLHGGETLSDSLTEMKLFNSVNLQMITVGENTGRLADVFANLGEFYETELDYALRRLLSLFEPLLIVGMGLIVGVIVLSMFLPIIQMAVLIR